ncbi:MAG: acyl-ACP thioesterase [Spirochaetaceae bacterium]|jgi:acyl-ACP thioesterase|nr:acyl-ACP thioesterase [Spirochaetaceae bacterium]
MLAILQESITVPFSGVDKTNRMKLSTAFDFFQDAANNHAEDLGVGRDEFERAGHIWVLSRMSVFMERRPEWNEELVMRTWPRGTAKLFAIRDYELADKEGKSVVRGRSGWIIVESKTRRPLRPEALVENMPRNEGRDALPDGAGAVPALREVSSGDGSASQAVRAAERRAAYSDIDMNGHVNNARYIEWIEDALDPGRLYGAEHLRLDINYTSEVLPGETIELWTSGSQPLIVEGRKAGTDQVAFRAGITAAFSA